MEVAERVLGLAAELALRTGTRMLEPAVLERACAEQGIGHVDWFAALVALRGRDEVALQTTEPSFVVLLAMTNKGLLRHLRRSRPDLDEVRHRLATAVSGNVGRGPVALADEVDEPPLLVECLLDRWVSDGRLVYSKAPRRMFRVHQVLAELPGPAAAPSKPAAG